MNMRPTISSWRTGHCASVMVKPSSHHSVANVVRFKPFISSKFLLYKENNLIMLCVPAVFNDAKTFEYFCLWKYFI